MEDSYMMNRFGLATCFSKQSTPQKWRDAADAGFQDAEIDVDRTLSVPDICAASQALYTELKDNGLDPTSFHLPFGEIWDVSSEEPAIRQKAIRELKLLLQWVGEMEIGIAVLHPSFEPIPSARRRERMEIASESIQFLGKFGKDHGVTLAVENLPRTCLGNCADEIQTLVDQGKSAFVCFDVNHLLKETHREFIQKAGDYFVTTHLSDYDRVDERHWLPGDGCIDWRELVQLLNAKQYKGRYLFELNEASSPSLNRIVTPQELMGRFVKLTGLIRKTR
jgi:sugar phosphate isomerase/epimerase